MVSNLIATVFLVTQLPLSGGELVQQAPTSELRVIFPSLPQGVEAKAVITTPSGEKETIKSNHTMGSLQAGTYTLVTSSVRAPGDILDTVYDGGTTTFEVKKSADGKLIGGEVAGKYTVRGGTGFFWFASERINDDDDFSVGQLRGLRGTTVAGGSASQVDRYINHAPRTQSSAIDGNGFVYVLDGWEGRVLRYSPVSLGSAGKATVHTGSDLPMGHVSVDLNGNVWLSDNDRAVMISNSDLNKSTYAPQVVLTRPDDVGGWGYPVFDGENNLYFVGTEMTVLSPNDRLKTGSPQGRNLRIAEGTAGASAFDRQGNLWVPNENGMVIMYRKSDLSKTGEIRGVETSAPQSTQAVAFDNKGGMIIFVRYGGTLLYRNPEEISSDGGKELGDAARASMYTNLLASPPPSWSPLAKVKGWPTP